MGSEVKIYDEPEMAKPQDVADAIETVKELDPQAQAEVAATVKQDLVDTHNEALAIADAAEQALEEIEQEEARSERLVA